LEGRLIGRRPLDLDRLANLEDLHRGQSLGQIAKANSVSRATEHRVIHEKMPVQSDVPKALETTAA
jgi:hypothetical protein